MQLEVHWPVDIHQCHPWWTQIFNRDSYNSLRDNLTRSTHALIKFKSARQRGLTRMRMSLHVDCILCWETSISLIHARHIHLCQWHAFIEVRMLPMLHIAWHRTSRTVLISNSRYHIIPHKWLLCLFDWSHLAVKSPLHTICVNISFLQLRVSVHTHCTQRRLGNEECILMHSQHIATSYNIHIF